MSINKPGDLTPIEQEIDLAQHWDNLYSYSFDELPWRFNPYPDSVFTQFVAELAGVDDVLDYGCGAGRYYDILRATGANVTCVDISSVAIEICGRTHPEAITFKAESPEDLADQTFSGILLWGVLHHIPPRERGSFWRHLSQKLIQGGTVLLGGWSVADLEQGAGRRVSSITRRGTWNIDIDLADTVRAVGLEITSSGLFPFAEAVTGKNRIFSYYLLKKGE